jgi:hypothetical protein
MKKILVVLMVLVYGTCWGATETQITTERDALCRYVWYVYQPTQKGDYYRWRLATANLVLNGYDNTYPCLAGVDRGYVYSGTRKLPGEHDATGGTWDTGTHMGFNYATCDATADTKTFNIPSNSTHVRAWFDCLSASQANCKITYLTSGDVEISYDVPNITTNAEYVEPTRWFAIPATAAKVKIHRSASYFIFCGIDFINTNSAVAPDTAGSMMFDGTGGNTKTVCGGGGWGGGLSANSTELAVYWDVVGGSFNSNKGCGGMAHKGIKQGSGTITWQTQSTTGAVATSDSLSANITDWASTYKGVKAKADFMILTMTNFDAYGESLAYTNIRGAYSGTLVFSTSGCSIYTKLVPSTDMEIWESYLVQCPTVSDLRYIIFEGDPTKYTLASETVRNSTKATKWTTWGGANNTVYIVTFQDAAYAGYYRYASNLYKPRIYGAAGAAYKIYANAYVYTDNSNAHQDFTSGTILETRFRIDLTDITLSGIGDSSPFARIRRGLNN